MSVRPLRDEDQHIVAKDYAPRSSRASFPVPAAQSTEAPTYCLKINAHWVGHVVGLLMALDQQDAWAGSGGDIEFARNEARKLIASLDVCGDDEPMADCTPIGAVMIWFAGTIPDGWLICDGSSYDVDEFPELAAVLGAEYISGDTFQTPNMSGQVPVGVNPTTENENELPAITLGQFVGEAKHQLTQAELPVTNPRITAWQQAADTNLPGTSRGLSTAAANIYRINPNTGATTLESRAPFGSGFYHNNMQPSRGVWYIIKALNCESEPTTVMSYKLRQNPENSCLLEQTLDGGTTWIPAFDYNECFGEMKQDVKDIKEMLGDLSFGEGNTYITNIINEYGGDVTNIYPDAPYGDDDDINRDAALCFAIAQWTLYLKELIKELIAEANDDDIGTAGLAAGAFAAASSIAGALLGFGIAVPGGMFLVGGLALAGALAAITELVLDAKGADISDEDIDAFDTSDFECCVYESMKGITISEALFQNNFTVCASSSFGTGELDNLMREMLLIIAQDKRVFVDFLKFLAIAFPLAQAGVSLECGCVEGICEAQDFAADGMGTWTFPAGDSYVAGEGVRGEPAPLYGHARCSRDLGMLLNITRIDMTWYCPRNDDSQRFDIESSTNNTDWTMLKTDNELPIGARTDTWTGSITARYIRLTATGSVVNTRAGQIMAANVCYE